MRLAVGRGLGYIVLRVTISGRLGHAESQGTSFAQEIFLLRGHLWIVGVLFSPTFKPVIPVFQ